MAKKKIKSFLSIYSQYFQTQLEKLLFPILCDQILLPLFDIN